MLDLPWAKVACVAGIFLDHSSSVWGTARCACNGLPRFPQVRGARALPLFLSLPCLKLL